MTMTVTITGKVVVGDVEYPVQAQVELPDTAPAPLRAARKIARPCATCTQRKEPPHGC